MKLDAGVWRLDHAGLGVSDLHRSAAFYDAALGALGLVRVMGFSTRFEFADPNGADLLGIGYGVSFPIFWIDLNHPADSRTHIGFRARDRREVDAFHAAGLDAGGRDHGAPGDRFGGRDYYAAFLLDPDGHNIEAVYRED